MPVICLDDDFYSAMPIFGLRQPSSLINNKPSLRIPDIAASDTSLRIFPLKRYKITSP